MSEFGMRPSIEWMKKYFGNKPVVGVELGVFKGVNAERLLSMLNIECLHLVDLWITPDCLKDKYDYEEHEKIVREKFRSYLEILIFKMDTVKASEIFKDESLDLVYVDANHSYAGCKGDNEAWYPKVKKGGIMCGHDYYACEGVRRAVDEFIANTRICSCVKDIKIFDAIGINDKVKYGEWLVIK